MNRFLVIFAFLFCFAVSEHSAVATDSASPAEMDRILDKLESRTPMKTKKKSTDKKITTYEYPKAVIESRRDGNVEIDQIASSVARLDKEVEQLASDVQKMKRNVLATSKVDSFVDLEAQLVSFKDAALTNLFVKLDNFELYKIHDTAGLWIPSFRMPVFSGPLKPGSHRIDVDARIVLKHKEPLKVNNDVFRLVTESFVVNVPSQTKGLRYVIELTAPQTDDGPATAKLREEWQPAL